MHIFNTATLHQRWKTFGWRLSVYFLFLFCWLLTHPYRGFRHDAVFYVGQAQRILQSNAFANDLFFKYGSQDQFTAFSNLYAQVIAWCGISVAPLALLVYAQVLFVFALIKLLHELFDAPVAWISAIAVASASSHYGIENFSYGEAFLTARSFAEPLCLLALAYSLRQRWITTLLMLGGAGAMHPLTTLPAIILCWVIALYHSPRLGFVGGATGLVLFCLLAISGVSPFDRIFLRYDDQWWQWVKDYNGFLVLPWYWSSGAWASIVADFLVLFLAIRNLNSQKNQVLLIGALIVGLGALIISVFGSAVLQNVLLTQLQLWRATWFVHLLAVSMMVALIVGFCDKGDATGRACALMVATALVAGKLGAVGALVLALIITEMSRIGKPVEPRVTKWMAGLFVATIFAAIWRLRGDMSLVSSVAELGDFSPFMAIMIIATKLAIVVAMIIFLVNWAVTDRKIAVACLSVLLVVALAGLNRRSDWRGFLETEASESAEAVKLIPPAGTVYWPEDDLLGTWIGLGRASYYSLAQSAGLLYNRDTAVEFSRRQDTVAAVEMQMDLCQIIDENAKESGCVLSDDILDELCSSESGPDVVVLSNKINRPILYTWKPGVGASGKLLPTQYIYACSALRQG